MAWWWSIVADAVVQQQAQENQARLDRETIEAQKRAENELLQAQARERLLLQQQLDRMEAIEKERVESEKKENELAKQKENERRKKRLQEIPFSPLSILKNFDEIKELTATLEGSEKKMLGNLLGIGANFILPGSGGIVSQIANTTFQQPPTRPPVVSQSQLMQFLTPPQPPKPPIQRPLPSPIRPTATIPVTTRSISTEPPTKEDKTLIYAGIGAVAILGIVLVMKK